MRKSFSPCRIGSCTIKNRFVMTAANLGWCREGFVNDKVTAFYKERAAGGVGLIIVGAAGVDPERINQVGMMQIYDDCFIPAMQKMTREVHQEGARIFLQLMHAGAYARREEHAGAIALAPSNLKSRFTGEEAREATVDELADIVEWFGKAALRARQAGFDGVELIGSAGYLIAEFLSARTNQRKDIFGGDIGHRTRFLLEIIREIRESAGEDYPLIVRLSGSDFIPGGNGPEEFLAVGKAIAREVDAINVTGGWHESQVPQITYHVPRGQYLYLARALKEEVQIPVIGCNRLDARTADQAIENGFCDMAGILRGLIADPYLVKKYQDGRPESICPCLACNQACLERIFSGKDLRCVVNPYVGREGETRVLRLRGKKILVVGAGIAGMACAMMMAPENQVVVREKSGLYGGAARAVGRLPHREDVNALADYLYHECIVAGVSFEWYREVTAKDLKLELIYEDYDHIVIACGAGQDQSLLPLADDGADLISAQECITEREPLGKDVVVIGSGYKAVQTVQYLETCLKNQEKADFLSRYAPEYAGFAKDIMETGKGSITLLAPGEKVGGGFGKSMKWLMLGELKASPVKVIKNAVIKEIRKDRIIYSVNEECCEIPCDLAVLAEGYKGYAACRKLIEEYPDKLSLIGDAKRPGRISEAVADAYDEAYR